MAIQVPAKIGQVEAYVAAELFIGFWDGYPLNFLRLLDEPIKLRASIGPDGFATFKLRPYLRTQLGVSDGLGGTSAKLPAIGSSENSVGNRAL